VERHRTLAPALLAVFLAALDAYVVVTTLVPILDSIRLPINRLERATPIFTAFLLGYIVAMPLLGRVSDAVGRRPVLLGALGVFALGSGVSALASSLPILVAGRLLQGAGGGALVPVTLALTADLYPAGGRTIALGVVAAVQEAGSLVGPLYGGVVAQQWGWRWIFWINLPVAAVLGWLGWRWLPRSAGRPQEPIDWWGALWLSVALAALILALYPDDPERSVVGRGFVPFGLVALGALALFAWRERRAAAPLLARALFARRPAWGAGVVTLLAGAGLMVALVDVPLIAQTVFGLRTLGAAWVLFRFMVALPLGALLGGLLARRLGSAPVVATGLLLAAAAFFQMAGWQVDALHAGHVFLPLVLAGTGFGLILAPLSSALLAVTPASERGTASALLVVLRMVGMLAGLSALAAIGLHRFYEQTRSVLAPIPGTPNFRAALKDYEAVVRVALLGEYQTIFAAAALICLAGVVVALLTLWPAGRRG
jgi:multidrug resistance protein